MTKVLASLFVRIFLLFDRHVLQFAGLENISTFLAFHIFGVFVPGDDLHARMLARLGRNLLLRGLRRLAKRHNMPNCSSREREYGVWPELAIFCVGEARMSSTLQRFVIAR
jgi:hypothetical protein